MIEPRSNPATGRGLPRILHVPPNKVNSAAQLAVGLTEFILHCRGEQLAKVFNCTSFDSSPNTDSRTRSTSKTAVEEFTNCRVPSTDVPSGPKYVKGIRLQYGWSKIYKPTNWAIIGPHCMLIGDYSLCVSACAWRRI